MRVFLYLLSVSDNLAFKANRRDAADFHEHRMISTLQIVSVGTSALLYYGFFHLNEWLFSALEVHRGANWIFLPAGLRLLNTLVLGGEGAIGLLIASFALSFGLVHSDPITAAVSPFISAGAPYLIYRFALARGLPSTLEKLTPASLSVLIVMYAAASSSLHSTWYSMRGVSQSFLSGFSAMFIGDLIGTLIMVYLIKLLLMLWDRRRKPPA